MADIELPRLADNRSTQRLVNVLRQLEESLANAAAVGAAPAARAETADTPVGAQINGEITRLRQQNKQLRNRQREASDRLDDLMTRIQSQLSAQPEAAQQENAA
jgi:hypothetical protein